MKKMIASTFVAAAVVLSIPAPSNAATVDTAKSAVVKPAKPAIDWYTPTRIDWY
ncbi:hypothetical protein [Aeromicrobium phragmitis]|uniref:hypothetical protein n=1 Tax=Aeromicrobium phragmitis TaxID=2478914 RepID=UPI0014078624|nr:hypothetical protein [Aeromicrobium phragmitis]